MRTAYIYDRLGETLPILAVVITESAWERVRTPSRRTGLVRGQGVVINPCSAVHTLGRRGPIDLLFLEADWTVRRVIAHLAPWRAAFCIGAARAVELGAGEAARLGLAAGMKLYCLAESEEAESLEAYSPFANGGMET